ncbi:FIP1 [Tripterygium wilfordii]|uniref:FIP1 n=1 Tax=Tripterygium wilfordii TaxID=458696 RepID=A0A7J7D6X1_TRIWF|nr:FIP1[V]-like protein [Tripterygium wilfordii]KAF5742064.1 FIP1 [Tripterygium wilfordii]
MEDDDEFGDLYTDVLKPFSSTSSSAAPQVHLISPAPPVSLRPIDLKQENIKNSGIINDGGDEEIMYEAGRPNSSTQVQTHPPDSPAPAKVGGFVLNSTGGDAVPDNSAGGTRVREDAKLLSRSELLPAEDTDMEFDIEDGITNQGIPGLSSSDRHDELINLGNTDDAREKDDVEGRGGEEDDWDSDSDDDLRILLNDVNQGPMGMNSGGLIGDDGDDEDDGGLNIVADGDPPHQVMAEQEWGEDAAAKVADGEKKEGGEAGKDSAANAVVPKIGYSNHGYQYPFHSQFKYVRPGATPMPGASTVGPGGAPGQVRPPVNIVPAAGRGRGDWRPMGMKSFHPGFGMPGRGNNMGRGFGGGLEFTLPSHKTIFDVDIDTFEEKPWKYPGVDISDFFNFGLNEESWKDYCKQLEQHRLETTMQSRIRVYESGRAEQDYDPDLPPELAAAAGIHDVTADNANLGKPDVVQSDSAKLPARVRPPIPTGRVIPVEGGSGERLPSIDTRPPRIRDSDAIIEIILHDSLEDEYSKGNVVDSDPTKGDLRGSPTDEEDDAQMVMGYFAYDSRKRKLVRRTPPYMDSVTDKAPDRDGVVSFPSEAPLPYSPSSRGQTLLYPSGKPGTPEERRTQGRARERSPQQTPSESTRDNKFLDNDEEEAVESTDARHGSMLASPVTVRDELEASAEHKDIVQDEIGLAEGNSGVEKDKLISSPNNMSRDGTSHHAMKNQKLSSQVEQPRVEEPDDAENSKAARSSENSKARSGSSRDDQKSQDGVEEEVIQGHSTRSLSIKRHLDENEKISHRKDRDIRYEVDDTNRVVSRGMEDSYASRDMDPRLSHRLYMKNEGFDRRKERNNPDGAWQRRDEDPQARKKHEDTRKREHGEEMGTRYRGKVRESERGDKDEHFHSKKQLDNGSYRVRYEKDVGSENRERDDSLKNRYEIVDDYNNKRRRDEEHLRRDFADKEEILHAHRESSSRRKREKDDVLDPRKRNDQQRVRDNIDDYHSVRHKDEIWMDRERGEKQREREEWHRLKQSHEENLLKREREEGRAAMRSGRGADDRAWAGHARARDEYKGSDKEIQLKDTFRHGDLKRDESFSHHRGRDDVYLRGSQFSHAEKRSRQERSSSRNDRGVSASDNQKMHEKKQKENVRKNKESEAGDHYTSSSSKRNQEDQSGLNEMGFKGMSERRNGSSKIPTQHGSSRKHREDASSDDEQQDSKRGRSKLERWTSHLERDYSINSKSAASQKFKDMDRKNSDGASEAGKPEDEPIKTVDAVDYQHPSAEENSAGNVESKDGDAKPMDDRHLDTVEKLKKRSERFKLPMPSEKDALVIKKIESEALPTATSETPTDSEIKPERPARKRRWISN